MMENKVCKKCGQSFPATIEYFFRRGKNNNELRSKCRKCFTVESNSQRQMTISKRLRNMTSIICACGCGQSFPATDKWGRTHKYISGHNAIVDIKKRFWDKVLKGDNCWEWQGSRQPKHNGWGDYGRININGKVQLSHRFSWELHNGPIPEGMFVRHKCDNPPCVRPDHLMLGTPHENNMDMIRHGRSTAGEKNTRAKLTNEQVAEIRQLANNGYSLDNISNRFNVHSQTISKIIRYKNWTHI